MRLTASALPRAEACLGSCVLPAIPEAGEYADTGTAIDRYVQTRRLADVPEALRPYCAALPLERIPDGCEYQVAFAYNCRTGAVVRIPPRQDGYPDMPPEWVFGSSDIVGMRPGRAFLVDLKWGAYTIGRDPADDLQLGFLSMCAAKVARVSECETGFLRAGWDASLRYDMAVLDEWALDAIEERVRGLWHKQQRYTAPTLPIEAPINAEQAWEMVALSGATPPLSVGEHCTYCPARRNCPAMVQPVALALAGRLPELAAATLPTLDEARERIGALTLVDKGRLYERLDAAEEYLRMLKGILRDDARSEPLPLSGGKELAEVQWGSSESSDVAKAEIAALKEQLKERGEIKTIKVAQVRPRKARK